MTPQKYEINDATRKKIKAMWEGLSSTETPENHIRRCVREAEAEDEQIILRFERQGKDTAGGIMESLEGYQLVAWHKATPIIRSHKVISKSQAKSLASQIRLAPDSIIIYDQNTI